MRKLLSIILTIVMLLQTAAFAAPLAVTVGDSAVEMPMVVEENDEMALSAEPYPTDLDSMRKRAEAIVNYEWTPSTDIATWNGNPTTDGKIVFEKGVTVVGMPYTLFTWEFGYDSLLSLAQYKTKAASNYSGSAYCKAVGEQRVGPVYGSCCATFVSEVFGGSFMNGDSPRYDGCTGLMDSPYSETITNATVSQIREGDALVKDDYWHVIWVSEITDTKMVIYEQTYPIARKVTINKPSGNEVLVFGGNSYPNIVRSKEIVNAGALSSDSNIVINGVDIGYANGDYFTKNGLSCANNYWSNGRCHHNDVCVSATHSQCNCMRYWPSYSNCQVDLLATQCLGFARYCQWRTYGVYYGPDGANGDKFTDLTGSISKENCTASILKSKLRYCAPGTHVRTDDSGYHSVVIVYATDWGVQLAEANHDGYCIIRVRDISWESFATYMKEKNGIEYSASYISATPNPPNVEPSDGCDVDTNYPTPFNAYPKNGQTTVYTSVSGTTSGVEYISATDICTIDEVYTNGWLKVTYPLDSGGTKTRYCPTNDFLYDGSYTNIHSETTTTGVMSYIQLTNQQYQTISSNTSCTIVGEYDNYYQAIATKCSSSTGKFLVWIAKDAFVHTCEFIDEGSFEYDHPHRRYKICSCGKTQLIDGLIAFTELHTEGYDSAHPHKKYWHCTYEYCGINDYSYCNGETRYDASCAECTVPDKPIISVSKTTWSENDTIYFSWQACNNADYYYPMVYDSNGTRVAVVWGQSERSYTVRLSPGTYYLQVASVNDNTGKTVYSEQTAINVISLPTNESITASSDYILEGDTVTFTMYATNAVKYKYGIDSEHEILVFLEEAQGNTFSYTFDEPGEYHLWFEAVNSAGGSSLSSSFTFVVHPLVYDITFNANGGYWANGNIQKKHDVDIEIPDDWPTRTGYKFLGWSTTAGGNVQYLPGDTYVSNKNLALYAVWRANTYTVKYNANGGSGTMSNSTHTYDTAKALNANTFTKTGYTFLGWSTISSATTAAYIDQQSVKNLTSTNGVTVNLYAVWSKIPTYTVSYDANGGSGAPASQTKTHNVALTLSSTKPVKTGYTFKEWKTSSGVVYNPSGSYTANAGVTLVAQWIPITYTVKYNANGGSGTMSDSAHTYDVAKALNPNTFTRTGHTFLGWSTSASATTATYTDKQSVKNLTSSNSATVTFYAVWKANTYTVKYSANGGSGTMSDSAHTYDVAKALNANTFIRTGYTFLGWSTSASTTTATYTDKQSVKNLASANGATVTLYAVWKANTYTVKYNANGGSGSMSNSSHTYDTPKALSTNTFTRNGYSFLGWSTSASVTIAAYTDKQSVKNLASTNGEVINLYAIWVEKGKYIISFDTNGAGTTIGAQTKYHDEDLKLLSYTPPRTGYTFKEWLATNGVAYAPGSIYTANSTTTLVAQWKPNTYTIKYNANGGSGTMSNSAHTYDVAKALNANTFTRTGYTFLGWSTSASATTATYTDKQSVKNLTSANSVTVNLYAIWSKIPTYTVSYDANGGSGAPASQTKMHGTNLTLSSTIPSKTGYKFVNWKASDNALYNPGDTYDKNSQTTMVAQWKAITYKVKFDANGGEGTMGHNLCVYGSENSLDPNKFEREGYEFVGWSTNKSATEADFADKEKVLNLTTVDGDVVLLYAVWKKLETFEIEIWVMNEADFDEIVLTKCKGDVINLSDYKPHKTGYTFVAWSDVSAEKTYSPSDKYIVTEDAFIVSGMQPNTYIVYFDALGGIVVQDFKTVKFDSTYGELPVPTRNGYDFDGWYSKSSGGKKVTEETIVDTPDRHTLYARWIEKNISPVGIALNKPSTTLEIGSSETLTATITPSDATNKAVTWTSSDNSVATVSNGTVTAVGEGTATITVRTVDGNKTATCTVTVTKSEEEKPEEPDLNTKATVTLSTETGRAGDKVSVIVSLETDELINTIGISGITYDKNILTFDSFTQYDEVKDISVLSSFDKNRMAVAIAFEKPQKFNGNLFEINFIINENAVDGKEEIDVSSVIKLDSAEIAVKTVAGSVTVVSEMLGDINHDECVDMNDAVLLLQHSLFSDIYPLEYKGSVDFTKDGYVDMNDAVLLLQYSLFPDLYPIG